MADYRAINPQYGTMQDFETLCAEAKKRGIGIMLDMVFNHTSNDHRVVPESHCRRQDLPGLLTSGADGVPGNPAHQLGVQVRAARPGSGKSTWAIYYLHLFDVTQADLNWENPAVRREVCDILHFWRGKGVDAFRFDVVNLISKPDVFEDDDRGDGRRFYTDGPRIHQYLKRAARPGALATQVTVGEMSSTSLDNCVALHQPRRGRAVDGVQLPPPENRLQKRRQVAAGTQPPLVS